MMLSYMALVACNSRLPEVIFVFFGRGGEGKTLFLSDLMRSVRGTGFGGAQPSIFQTPGEFRRQGHPYRGLRWLSVGEARPTSGINEDNFKVFVTGGPLCLRGNHEAETLR